MVKYLTMLSLVFGLSAAIFADEKADAQALVKKAALFMKANGHDKTIAALSDSTSGYVKGELYVFAYTLGGVMATHPKNAKLIGKNLLEVPDVDGKMFRKEIIDLAKTKGSGWVDYKYKNPTTNKIEEKTTWLFKEGDLILCCGVYK